MGFLDAINGSDDPSTADSYGLTQADRRQQLWSLLTNVGGTLLAAGSPSATPGGNMAMLANLANVPGQVQQMRASQIQSRLAAQKNLDDKRAQDLMKTEDFQKALAALPPDMKAVAMLGPKEALGVIAQHRQQISSENTAKYAADRQAQATERAYTLQAQRDEASAKRQEALIAAQNARAQSTNDARTAQLYGKPLSPGQTRVLPDGSVEGVGDDGRYFHRPAPSNAPPGPTSFMQRLFPGMPSSAPAPQAPQASPVNGPVPQAPQQGPMPQTMPAPGPAPITPAQGQLTAPPPPTAADDTEMTDITKLPQSPHGWQLDYTVPSFKTLSPSQQVQAARIATYNAEPLKTGTAKSGRTNTLVMKAVNDITGGKYDDKLFRQISDTNKVFGSGRVGDAISSLGTGGGHMIDLWESQKGLDTGDLTAWNKFIAKLRTETGDDKTPATELAGLAVGGEVAKAVHGPGPVPEAEKQEWQKKFAAASMSPKALAGVITEARQLMKRRESQYRQQYRDATGGAEWQGQMWPTEVTQGLDKIAEEHKRLAAPKGAPAAPLKPGKYKYNAQGELIE